MQGSTDTVWLWCPLYLTWQLFTYALLSLRHMWWCYIGPIWVLVPSGMVHLNHWIEIEIEIYMVHKWDTNFYCTTTHVGYWQPPCTVSTCGSQSYHNPICTLDINAKVRARVTLRFLFTVHSIWQSQACELETQDLRSIAKFELASHWPRSRSSIPNRP